MLEKIIKSSIRDVKDFPKKGIIFKDITPILQYPQLTKQITNKFAANLKKYKIDAIAAIESRGFLFGIQLAQKLGVPFVLIRKKGKLPYKTISHKYELEYGLGELEIHIDAIKKNDSVLIHDDLFATGGTAVAAAELIKNSGGIIAGFAFLVELDFLKSRDKLHKYSHNIVSLVHYF